MFIVVAVVICAAAGAVLCELCDRLFHERMDYKHHFKRRHLGQFNIRCDACCKGFWKTSALRQHTCYPEMRDENIRLQSEREEAALRQRTEIRASMGLGEGAGIDVVDVVETQKADGIPEKSQDTVSESSPAEISSLSACDSTVVPAELCSPPDVESSENISESSVKLSTVIDNNLPNTSGEPEVNTLPRHGYGTRKKRISFRQMQLGLMK